MHEIPPPIPLPGPSPKRVAEKSDKLVFKCSFWKMLVFVFVWWTLIPSFLLFPIMEASRRGKDERFEFAVVTTAITILGTAVIREVWKVVVTTSGIKGYGFWGAPIDFSWVEMKDTRPANFCGLHSLRLHSNQDKRVMWLPLYLSDRKGFNNAVIQFAPPDNPLRRHLEENTK